MAGFKELLIIVFELYISELPGHIAYNTILIHIPSIIAGGGLPVPNRTPRGHQSARLIDITFYDTVAFFPRVFPFPKKYSIA